MNIFSGNETLSFLHRLIIVVFSLAVSNAFVERMFSLVVTQWTKVPAGSSNRWVPIVRYINMNVEWKAIKCFTSVLIFDVKSFFFINSVLIFNGGILFFGSQ